MMSPRFQSALICTLLGATLAGCSQAQNAEHTVTRPEEPPRQFSQEERLAARVLSIGSRGFVQQSDNSYEQAVVCSSAIDTLMDRLRQTGILTVEQLQAVEQAKAVYDRRVQVAVRQAGAANPSATDGNEEPADENASRGQALQAIGCIQRLAEAG